MTRLFRIVLFFVPLLTATDVVAQTKTPSQNQTTTKPFPSFAQFKYMFELNKIDFNKFMASRGFIKSQFVEKEAIAKYHCYDRGNESVTATFVDEHYLNYSIKANYQTNKSSIEAEKLRTKFNTLLGEAEAAGFVKKEVYAHEGVVYHPYENDMYSILISMKGNPNTSVMQLSAGMSHKKY